MMKTVVTLTDLNDTYTAPAGDYDIDGQGGNNTITTGAGNSIVSTGSGNDTITTGAGYNIVTAGDGNNTITTGAGGGMVTTGAGSDTITTGGGDDVIYTGGGSDIVTAAAGSDVLVYVVAENSTVGTNDNYDGGAGFDTLRLALTSAEWMRADIRADVAKYLEFLAANNGANGGDNAATFTFSAFALTVSKVEKLTVSVNGVDIDPATPMPMPTPTPTPATKTVVTLTDLNDTYTAPAGDYDIDGQGGNNTITTGAGNNIVSTGSGNDIIATGGGDDVIYAGGGSDIVTAAAGSDVLVYVVAENSTVGINDNYDGGAGFDTLRLALTGAEWMRADIRADIAKYLEFLAANNGANGGDNAATFTFSAFALTVSNVEKLTVSVNGVDIDPANHPVTQPINDAPTLSGIPLITQTVTLGVAAVLPDFTVADTGSTNLTLTLTATNGTLNGVTDSDPARAGIQLTGTAASINAAIAGATFTAAAAGAASIGVSLSDGVNAATTGSYSLEVLSTPTPVPTPTPTPTPATLSTITALNSGVAVLEGAFAIASFALDKALVGVATIAVQVEGWSATLDADTSGPLQYQAGGVGAWADVVNGTVDLVAGTTQFNLRVQTVNDNETESAETLNFIAAQVSGGGSLTGSWWVTSLANITDTSSAAPTPAPAPATLSTITALNSGIAVLEGAFAIASFALDKALVGVATIAVQVEGWSATLDVDTSGPLQYQAGGVGAWADVVNGTVDLAAGTTQFNLRVQTVNDNETESAETLNFIAAQVSGGGNLTGSWWVTSLANITDISSAAPTPAPAPAPAPAPTATLSTITALNSGFEVIEDDFATASFKLDKALVGVAKIAVQVEGWSATLDADTSGPLQYQAGGVGAWADVVNGIVDLAAGTTQFSLRVQTVNDLKTESAETLNFTAAQVSGNLTGSWWVSVLGTLVDQAPFLRLGTTAIETLTGSNTEQDVFNMTTGKSVAVAGQFDTIHSFGQGDIIQLPAGINEWSISSTNANAFTGHSGTVSEVDLLSAIQSMDGQFFQSGQGGSLKIQNGSNTYLIADTNGDGKFNTSLATADKDMMVKLTGAAAFGLTTGESIASA